MENRNNRVYAPGTHKLEIEYNGKIGSAPDGYELLDDAYDLSGKGSNIIECVNREYVYVRDANKPGYPVRNQEQVEEEGYGRRR